MPNSLSIEMLILIVVIVVILFSLLLLILSRYKKCPSDKVMVIYGNVGNNRDGSNRTAKCIHGGASFIWPVVQAYEFLDLTPISISVDLQSALSRQNIRINVPSRFTVGISTEPGVMQNAAERLLGLKLCLLYTSLLQLQIVQNGFVADLLAFRELIVVKAFEGADQRVVAAGPRLDKVAYRGESVFRRHLLKAEGLRVVKEQVDA